jgi:hypothetical protein
LRLGLFLEQHDSECWRCGQPKSSEKGCVPCWQETGELWATPEGSVPRAVDETEKRKDDRLRENRSRAENEAK